MTKEEKNRLSLMGAIFAAILLGIIILGAQSSSSEVRLTPSSSSTPVTTPSTSTLSSNPPATFHGDNCTSDCSGHEAGYEWGEDNDICDTEYDSGNSESFNEGVRSWAEENCGDSSDEYEYDY